MEIRLIRASVEDAEIIWKMQVEAFAQLLERYQDRETNPASEPLENVIWRLEQKETFYYIIEIETKKVGAIRVIDKENKRISPIFILPKYRNQGIAQKAIEMVEEIHGKENWELDTILQEKGNCYLYEKMGYQSTGKTTVINDKLTLILYKK